MGKLLKAAGSIASPVARLGMTAGKELKANANDEIKNPAKNKLYKNVNKTVAKILGTEPEQEQKQSDEASQKDKSLQSKIANLAAENGALKTVLNTRPDKQAQNKNIKQDNNVKGIDIEKEMPNLYRNMQEQQNEAQLDK